MLEELDPPSFNKINKDAEILKITNYESKLQHKADLIESILNSKVLTFYKIEIKQKNHF